jgi:hypothetical protein
MGQFSDAIILLRLASHRPPYNELTGNSNLWRVLQYNSDPDFKHGAHWYCSLDTVVSTISRGWCSTESDSFICKSTVQIWFEVILWLHSMKSYDLNSRYALRICFNFQHLLGYNKKGAITYKTNNISNTHRSKFQLFKISNLTQLGLFLPLNYIKCKRQREIFPKTIIVQCGFGGLFIRSPSLFCTCDICLKITTELLEFFYYSLCT